MGSKRYNIIKFYHIVFKFIDTFIFRSIVYLHLLNICDIVINNINLPMSENISTLTSSTVSQRSSFVRRGGNFAKTKWGVALIVLVLIILAYAIFHKKKSPFTFVAVTRGSITEAVSVTGNTTPIKSVMLGFQNGGAVAEVYSQVGQKVYAGQVLAQLNTYDLSAQLRQAEAQVDAQNAKLASIKFGAQPQDIEASNAAVEKATQDLSNMYSQIADISNDAFSKANDAVRTQTNSLFSNPENPSIALTFVTSNTQAATNAKTERLSSAGDIIQWQQELAELNPQVMQPDAENILKVSLAHLANVRTFLLDISTALNNATSLDTTSLALNKANMATAITEVNIAIKNLNIIAQNIASQKLTVSQLEAQLSLKKAGATDQDIKAQQAQVEQAQAGVQSVQAKIANSRIVSPIDGVVTQFDAKVGQIATPGITLISVISNAQFEVDAQVPETDIGRVAAEDMVNIRFDAFPNETFKGKVFYIDPAQTINQGVVNYKIKISFVTADVRLKSGLTANLTIETKTKANTLIVPQYAIVQNAQGAFVQIVQNGKATSTPVTLGIQDQNGNVEVLTGVTEGEQVLNIGLKQ